MAEHKRYAVVNDKGVVVNLVVWDGETEYNVKPSTLVDITDHIQTQIGAIYQNDVFTNPVVENEIN